MIYMPVTKISNKGEHFKKVEGSWRDRRRKDKHARINNLVTYIF